MYYSEKSAINEKRVNYEKDVFERKKQKTEIENMR